MRVESFGSGLRVVRMIGAGGTLALSKRDCGLHEQPMTLDQKLQVWMTVGTWVAGLATLLAVMTSLHLARRAERIRLRVFVGLREIIRGDGSPPQTQVCFDVTNAGERPVVVNTIGWVVGKRKKRRYCIQPVSGPWTQQYPIELTHGKNARFMVSLSATPDWFEHFSGFVDDPSGRSLKTLRAQVFTSVGRPVEVKPEDGLISKLREAASRQDTAPPQRRP